MVMSCEYNCKECKNLECKSRNSTIEMLSNQENGVNILTKIEFPDEKPETYIEAEKKLKSCTGKGIVVDIGTTTIAMQLVSLASGEVENTYTTVNRQRIYGADVISRIKASIAGEKKALRESIQSDLLVGIKQLAGSHITSVGQVIIAGNTTMIHLLMGYDCDALGVYPFTPVNIKTIEATLDKLLDTDICDAKVTIYPGISTYVGGDIVSGLLALGFAEKEKVSMLIDLGTNGEMAIGNKDRILVTSTAAGPAFEGGNIVGGVASVPGAIYSVDIDSGVPKVRTIGDKLAIGICGTGAIELVAQLFENELIDETGLFADEYFDEGFCLSEAKDGRKISIYQRDIREIQLAKAAVRAGVEILISQYGMPYDKIEKVYIAGGFGYKMDIKKALMIGLLPKELAGKIEAVGNSCLGGAHKYLLKESSKRDIRCIIDSSLEVQLSNDKEFNDLYVKYMYFG